MTHGRANAQTGQSATTTSYQPTDDDPVTEWGPGAVKLPEDEWESADAHIAFTDIGYVGPNRRAQIVAYGQRHRNLTPIAVSVELDGDEARKIAAVLLDFANRADFDATWPKHD